MRKLLLIFCILFIISIKIYSQDSDLLFSGTFYPNPDITYIFNNGILSIDEFINKNNSNYSLHEYWYEEINKVPFLHIKTDTSFEKYLVIYSSDFLLLYKSAKTLPESGGFFGRYIYDLFLSPVIYSSSSFLDDNKYNFSSNNLGNLELFKPWVEGVDGVGVGQKLFLKYENKDIITGFYLSNGFVSYDSPQLYEQNSRVKRIKVYNSDNTFLKEFEVLDNPQIQYFKVPKTDNIIIEIVDVYNGSKWDDTCINFILLESQL